VAIELQSRIIRHGGEVGLESMIPESLPTHRVQGHFLTFN